MMLTQITSGENLVQKVLNVDKQILKHFRGRK